MSSSDSIALSRGFVAPKFEDDVFVVPNFILLMLVMSIALI